MKECIHILERVLKKGESLSPLLHNNLLSSEDKALCFGVIRWYHQLDEISKILLNTPLKSKDFQVQLYLLLGLFQLLHMNMPDYAVVSEIVSAVKKTKYPWASGLLNKVLRRFIQERESIMSVVHEKEVGLYAHPPWMIRKLDKNRKILEINNTKAPLTLRVNLQKTRRDDYLKLLSQQHIDACILPSSDTALQLKTPLPIDKIPGFNEGLCSVQDEAGQLVATWLDLKPDLLVLDACSAPGGKTCHLLETEPHLKKITALDIDALRLQRVTQNLRRLRLDPSKIHLITADASHPDTWWDGQLFDRILIDAPCSGSGVIRRHPDIKLLRRETDLMQFQTQQLNLLNALIPLLKKDGLLIYSTCSIFPEENTQVIEKFIQEHPQVTLTKSLLLFPQENGHDGFFISAMHTHG